MITSTSLNIFDGCEFNKTLDKDFAFIPKPIVFTSGKFKYEGYNHNRVIRYNGTSRSHNIDTSFKNLTICIENNYSKWCIIHFNSLEKITKFVKTHFGTVIVAEMDKSY